MAQAAAIFRNRFETVNQEEIVGSVPMPIANQTSHQQAAVERRNEHHAVLVIGGSFFGPDFVIHGGH